MSFPPIESARLSYRPFEEGDLDRLHRLWKDPDVRRYLWDDEIIPAERATETIAACIECARDRGIGMWCLFLKPSSEFVGFCGFRFLPESADVEVLYGLAPEYWGRGLATEAARAALTYAFEERGYERILAGADRPNAASFRVMERIGMRPGGTGFDPNGSTLYYSVRREEFAKDPATIWRREV